MKLRGPSALTNTDRERDWRGDSQECVMLCGGGVVLVLVVVRYARSGIMPLNPATQFHSASAVLRDNT